MNNRYSSIEANMIQAIQKSYFQPPVAGWMYEVAPDFSLYKGTENWISTEASGIAMQAILGILEGNTPLLGTQVPSGSITPSVNTSPTSNPSQTTFSVSICPHGLGNCGDNAKPDSGGNATPKYQQQQVTLQIFDSTNNQIAQQQGELTYNTTTQTYQGTVSATSVQSGNYIVSVKLNGFLTKQIPGIISISPGQTITLPTVFATNGDINNDNQLDILDYNLLVSCFGTKVNTPSCTASPSATSPGADINYDGVVDGSDYNLLLRELAVQKGS